MQVNAYLTPQAAKGLELHFDYHDVFVVHLEGSKRWRVWEPLERTRLPVRAARVPMPTLAELGPPAFDRVSGQATCCTCRVASRTPPRPLMPRPPI